MKPSELVLDGDETEAICIVNSFVAKQGALVGDFREKLGGNTDVLSLRKNAPERIVSLNDAWAVAVHGVGVQFTNTRTGEVVDVHVGVFDAPDAVDAWRLGQYAESIHSGLEDFGPILEQLASKGVVTPHRLLPNHYELPPVFTA
jgi:hypothetical protein